MFIIKVKKRPKEKLCYLAVVLDKNMNYDKHLTMVLDKAHIVVASLTRILPNTGENKRHILYSVINSILLYAVPVWKEVYQLIKYRKLANTLQRKIALRICTGINGKARVLLMIIPIDMAEERTRIIGRTETEKRVERENTIKMTTEMGQ